MIIKLFDKHICKLQKKVKFDISLAYLYVQSNSNTASQNKNAIGRQCKILPVIEFLTKLGG